MDVSGVWKDIRNSVKDSLPTNPGKGQWINFQEKTGRAEVYYQDFRPKSVEAAKKYLLLQASTLLPPKFPRRDPTETPRSSRSTKMRCHGCHGNIGQGAHSGSGTGKNVCKLVHSKTCPGSVRESDAWRSCPADYIYYPELSPAPPHIGGELSTGLSTPFLGAVPTFFPPSMQSLQTPAIQQIQGVPESVQRQVDNLRSVNQMAPHLQTKCNEDLTIGDLRRSPDISSIVDGLDNLFRQDIPALSASTTAKVGHQIQILPAYTQHQPVDSLVSIAAGGVMPAGMGAQLLGGGQLGVLQKPQGVHPHGQGEPVSGIQQIATFTQHPQYQQTSAATSITHHHPQTLGSNQPVMSTSHPTQHGHGEHMHAPLQPPGAHAQPQASHGFKATLGVHSQLHRSDVLGSGAQPHIVQAPQLPHGVHGTQPTPGVQAPQPPHQAPYGNHGTQPTFGVQAPPQRPHGIHGNQTLPSQDPTVQVLHPPQPTASAPANATQPDQGVHPPLPNTQAGQAQHQQPLAPHHHVSRPQGELTPQFPSGNHLPHQVQSGHGHFPGQYLQQIGQSSQYQVPTYIQYHNQVPTFNPITGNQPLQSQFTIPYPRPPGQYTLPNNQTSGQQPAISTPQYQSAQATSRIENRYSPTTGLMYQVMVPCTINPAPPQALHHHF